MQVIRDTPWWLFYPLALATLGCIVALFLLLRKNSPSNQAVYNEGRWIAERLSKGKYYLKRKKISPFGVTLVLVTADLSRQKETITFRSGHPDFKQLKTLPKLEVIEFKYCSSALPRVDNAEVCAYLRLI